MTMENHTLIVLEFNEECQAIHLNFDFEEPINTHGWRTVHIIFDTERNDDLTASLQDEINKSNKSKKPMSFDEVCRAWERMSA